METITDINKLDLNKFYTYADYLKWQFDERVELIKGKIFKMSPAPSSRHQHISGNLFGHIWSYLKGQSCQAFSAPFDVRLPVPNKKTGEVNTVVQPDICVVCDQSKIDHAGCQGAPDLIVEILSPSSAKKDMKDKFHLYEESGVTEYWAVHPEEKLLEIFVLTHGRYQLHKIYTEDDLAISQAIAGLEVNMQEVFEE